MHRFIVSPDRIIDGSGAAPQDAHSVIVAGQLIEAVVPTASIDRADGLPEITLPGCTLTPGLINNHVHLVLPGDNTPFVPWIDLQSDASLALWAAHNAALSLRHGVTAVRDCGGRRTVVLDVRQAQQEGRATAARIISCGWTLTITGGHTRQFGGEVDGEVELRKAVREVISRGADYVKVMAAGGGTPGSLSQYPSFTREELTVITQTAHDLGKKVAAHCIATRSIENAIDAGVDMIEHASFYSPTLVPEFDPRVGEKLAKSGIPVTPTLQVARDLVDLEGPAGDPLWQRRQDSQREIVRTLRDLGVPLLAGSDAGWRATAFDTFWKELDELAICGLSATEVVHAATGGVTRTLGLGDTFGTLQPGQLADMVAFDGNPLDDIRSLARVHSVWQQGLATT